MRPGTCSEVAIAGHLRDAHDGFEGADEHAAGKAVLFATDIHAEVLAIDGVDVGVAGGTEEDLIARSGSAVRVRGGVRNGVVRSEIGFDFDDTASDRAARGLMNEQFAEEARRDQLRWRLVKAARQGVAAHFGCGA